MTLTLQLLLGDNVIRVLFTVYGLTTWMGDCKTSLDLIRYFKEILCLACFYTCIFVNILIIILNRRQQPPEPRAAPISFIPDSARHRRSCTRPCWRSSAPVCLCAPRASVWTTSTAPCWLCWGGSSGSSASSKPAPVTPMY